MPVFEKAPDSVESMARQIIDEFHKKDLGDADIAYLFRDKASSSGGRTRYATARKVPPWVHALTNLDFVIEIAEDMWEPMEDARRRALLDHELMHCYLDEDGEARIRPHDVEEFAVIIQRHGAWNHDLRRAGEAFKNAEQIPLPFEPPDGDYALEGQPEAVATG